MHRIVHSAILGLFFHFWCLRSNCARQGNEAQIEIGAIDTAIKALSNRGVRIPYAPLSIHVTVEVIKSLIFV